MVWLDNIILRCLASVGQMHCIVYSQSRFIYAKFSYLCIISGTGTNLKVGGGSLIRQKVPEIFFGRAPSLFCSKSTISRFGERFRGGQYSLVSFLFAVLLLTVLPVPSHL